MKGDLSPEVKKKRREVSKLPSSSSTLQGASKDFHGIKAATKQKLKRKVKRRKSAQKHKRKQALQEIFGAAKDSVAKQDESVGKKQGVGGQKANHQKHKGKKFSGKQGKVFARNRISKKMKRKRC